MLFWRLIDEARTGTTDCCETASRAVALAAKHPPPEISTLHQDLWRLMADSYQHRLWAAANLMMGGCTDDGFDYFRGWLLTRGPAVFAAALDSPDTLADQLRPSWLGYECETALSITSTAYERATGSPAPFGGPPGPLKIEWEFDLDDREELRRRLPRLSALFLR